MIQKVLRRKAGLLSAFFVALGLVAVTVPDETLEAVGTWVLIGMLLPANYFPLFYTVAFRWWGGHLGRALFIKALGLAVLLDTAMMVRFLGGEEWAAEVRFMAYSLVMVGMYYQSIVMTQIRVKAGHRRRERLDLPSEQEARTDMRGVDMRGEST